MLKKHCFIVPLHDHFMAIFIRNALDMGVFSPLNVSIFYFVPFKRKIDNKENEFEQRKKKYDDRIDVVLINCFDEHDFSVFQTVNFLSLNLYNSRVVYDFVKSNLVNNKNINIILTDDEVDRWGNLKEVEGRFVPSKAHHVDENILKSLPSLNNFLQLRMPWGDRLEKTLERKVNFVDTLLFFSILRYKDQDAIYDMSGKELVDNRKIKDSTSVMLFTKPKGDSFTVPWLLEVLKKVVFKPKTISRELELDIWSDVLRKNPNILFICYAIRFFSKINRVNVTLNFLQKKSPHIYFMSLMKYDFLVAQPRGGGGVIREFYKYSGEVIFYNNSLNSSVYKNNYHADIFEFSEIGDAVIYMMENKDCCFEKSRLVASKIRGKEKYSAERLRLFYQNS